MRDLFDNVYTVYVSAFNGHVRLCLVFFYMLISVFCVRVKEFMLHMLWL